MPICSRSIGTAIATLLLIAALAVPAAAQPSSEPPSSQPDPSQPQPAGSVRIGRGGLQVGETVSDTRKMEQAVTIRVTMNGQELQTVEQTQAESTVISATVLARTADTSKPAVMRIDFVSHERKASQNGIDSNDSDPTTGKSYRAALEGETVTVGYAGSSAEEPGVSETRGVELEFLGLIDGSHYAAALPDRAIAVGEVVDLDAGRLTKGFQLDGPTKGSVRAAKLTLKSVTTIEGRRVAVFDANISMEISPAPMVTVVMEQTGEVVLDVASGIALKTSLSGPIKVTGGQQTPEGSMDIRGEGTGRIDTQATIKAADDSADSE